MAPAVRIDDAPALPWRGLMLDLARFPHPVEAVEEAIELAYLFSLNTVQLHLSDDQAFTFPASCLPPRRAARRRRGSRLHAGGHRAPRALRRRARDRPRAGDRHAGPRKRARPRAARPLRVLRRGRDEWVSTGVINMASPRALEALDQLLAEVAAAFPSSPGSTSAATRSGPRASGRSSRPTRRRTIPATAQDGAIGELLSHFLGRMARRVTDLGRTPVLWEGFPAARIEANRVPSDIVVMSWSQNSTSPEDLLERGHGVINCNWEPLTSCRRRGGRASRVTRGTGSQVFCVSGTEGRRRGSPRVRICAARRSASGSSGRTPSCRR